MCRSDQRNVHLLHTVSFSATVLLFNTYLQTVTQNSQFKRLSKQIVTEIFIQFVAAVYGNNYLDISYRNTFTFQVSLITLHNPFLYQ